RRRHGLSRRYCGPLWRNIGSTPRLTHGDIENDDSNSQHANGNRIKIASAFWRTSGCGRRNIGAHGYGGELCIIRDGLIRIESHRFRERPHKSTIKNSTGQQMEFFVFDCRQKTSTDAGLLCNLVKRDPFGLTGLLETCTKIGHRAIRHKKNPASCPAGEGGMVEKFSLYAKKVKFQETTLGRDSVRDQRAEALAALQRSALHYCQRTTASWELPFRHPADTNGVSKETTFPFMKQGRHGHTGWFGNPICGSAIK